MSLTKKRIDSLRFDGRTLCFYPDGADGIPNFGVRVFKSGRKSFLLGYRLPGSRRQQWVTIGKYGVLTLDQVREKARAILVAVDQGESYSGSLHIRKMPLPSEGPQLIGRTTPD